MPALLGWKEKLESAKAAGYDFVEMPIRIMCLSGHRKYPLGIGIIQLAGYDVYYEASDEETKQNL